MHPRLLVAVPNPCLASHDWDDLEEPIPGWGLCRQCRSCGLLVTRSWWNQAPPDSVWRTVREVAAAHPGDLLRSVVALLDLHLPAADRAALCLLAQWTRSDPGAADCLRRLDCGRLIQTGGGS